MVRFATVAAVLAMMAAPLVAQESTEQLRKELESLRREVDGLKADRAQYESKEVVGAAKVDQDSMSPDGDSPVMTALKETKLSGFVDASYMVTVNAPKISIAAASNHRLFDNNPNSFYLNAVQLNLERLANEKMIVGYHLELAAGHDPLIYDGQTVSLQEGWAQILAPVGSGIDIRVGKMATLAGYEVIEAKDDMNISRGFLFGFAIPFTHTGIRAAYSVNDMLKFTLGVNNGWNALTGPPAVPANTFVDRDYGKTLELQVAVTPTKDAGIYLTVYVGDESTGVTAPTGLYAKRYLVDLVGTYTIDKLTLALEVDFGSQQEIVPTGRSGWSGFAAFAKFQATDVFAAAIRIEYLSDEKGGLGLDGGGAPGARVFDVTLTLETKVASQLILRFEFRADNSNDKIYFRGGKTSHGQDTIGLQAIMPF